MTGAFPDRVPAYLERVERTLERWLPSDKETPERLHAAMRYAVLGGGKRVRPLLTYATGELLGIAPGRLDGLASAVEIIHAYSLVHDDLPAMDDDDLRRGRPTCHRAFDEATAILAGDALQVLAFEILTRDRELGVPPHVRLRMLEMLTEASGSTGMAGGQAIDLAAVGRELDQIELETMHRKKTGALIRASVLLAATAAAGLGPDRYDALDLYARSVGLAFQVQDDILDEEGDTAVTGKRSGADRARQKPTFPSILGLEASKSLAADLHQEAVAALRAFGDAAEPLRWMSEHIVTRQS